MVLLCLGSRDGPLEMYLEKTRTRRKNREKDSERYSPESRHIWKRYGELERVHSSMIVQTRAVMDILQVPYISRNWGL